MELCRKHWYAAVLIVALIAAAVVAHRDARERSNQEQRNYENCLVLSPRTAYVVAFTKAAADARRDTGDPAVADQYEALAQAQTETILAPKGYEGSDQLVQVKFKHGDDGRPRAQLTGVSMALLKEGCRQAYLA